MSSSSQKPGVVSQQKAWSNLMKTLAIVNMSRAKQAKRAAQELTRMRARS